MFVLFQGWAKHLQWRYFCKLSSASVCCNNSMSAITITNNHTERRNSRFVQSPHCTISSLHCELSPKHTLRRPGRYRVHITCNTLSTYHMQHVCPMVQRDSSAVKFELKLHLSQFYFIGWNHQSMKVGKKPECPQKTPDDELQKMPHTQAPKFKPNRESNPHTSTGRRKADIAPDVLTITPLLTLLQVLRPLILIALPQAQGQRHI